MFSRQHYDAIVVGSGPTGGWTAKTLTEAGMNVLVLEAGRSHRSMRARLFCQKVLNKLGFPLGFEERARTRQDRQSQCYAWWNQPSAFVDDLDNPYTTPPSDPFIWIRARQEGGRMAVPGHGLQFYRFSDHNFKAASIDGFGVDWPLTYAELAPFYARVEQFIGITGNRDNISHLPDPIPNAGIQLTPAERLLQSRIARQWPERGVIAQRRAKPPLPIAAARATGRLTLRTQAIVREVVVDPSTGLASGVAWLEDGVERRASARIVVLAASAIESARLLLNSRSRQFPNGLANSSDMVGRHLMDHTHVGGFKATITLPDDQLNPRPSLAYLPQFRNVADRRSDFLRGYAVHLWSMGRECSMSVRGEMLPRPSNRVTIDPARTDRWGIPAVHIECQYSDNERAQSQDAIAECGAMMSASGFDVVPGEPDRGDPGLAVHECGTARMGADPRTSVLNSYNQSWDVRNLFLVDGACFVSQGVQNPTLTMMALALRASEHIVDLTRRHEL